MKDRFSKKNKGKCNKDDVTEHPCYHKTEKLLKKYRDVVWSAELSAQDMISDLQKEFGVSIDDLLTSIQEAGADLSGTDIESHAKSIERTQKMLRILESSINLMRNKHKYGEEYYWILYYTYLSPQELENKEEIIEKLCPYVRNISPATYYRKRIKAIEALSSKLWGYTSRDCMDILNKIFLLENHKQH